MTKYNPQEIRETAAGFIGGKDIALLATDHEIVLLAKEQDQITALQNQLKTLIEGVRRQQKVISGRTWEQAEELRKEYQYNP